MEYIDNLPPIDLMCSEKMTFVQLIIPVEWAHRAVSYLSQLGLLQFRDKSCIASSSSADFPCDTLTISVSSIFNYTPLVIGAGLDVLADAKCGGSGDEGAFRVPRERVASVAASLDEDEEKSTSSGLDEVGNFVSNDTCNYANRRYRESASTLESNSESAVTEEHQLNDTLT